MFNGVSGLHEQGTLVIPWVVVLLLTFGRTRGTAIQCHVSYIDVSNALHLMTEQTKQLLVEVSCFLCVLSNFFVLKEVLCKRVYGIELAQDTVQCMLL